MATIASPQHLAALALANHVRLANAATFRELKARSRREGMLAVAEILRHADMAGPVGAMPVYRTLTAIRRMSETKAGQLLCRVQVFDPSRQLRRLSVRQRHLLAEALEAAASEIRS